MDKEPLCYTVVSGSFFFNSAEMSLTMFDDHESWIGVHYSVLEPLAFGESCWEPLLMITTTAIILMVRLPHSAPSFSWSLFLSTYLILLAFLHSCIPHQDMWELRISFTALQNQVYYPSPLFALSCYGTISTQLWLLCVDMWYHVVPSKSYKQERWYQPLLWPSVWGQHLKPKHIPSLISPSSSEHQNSFQFPEWQKLSLC